MGKNKHTLKEQAGGEEVLRGRLLAFKENWDIIKTVNFDVTDLKKPNETTEDAWNGLMIHLCNFTVNKPNKERVKKMVALEGVFNDKKLFQVAPNLLTCNDVEVYTAVKSMINEKNAASADKLVSTLQQAFYAIGRQMPWSQKVSVKNNVGTHWAWTGNPMTENDKGRLVKYGNQLVEQREKSASTGTNGLPASLAFVLYTIWTTFLTAVERVGKISRSSTGVIVEQSKRELRNLFYVPLSLMMYIHEGNRPFELYGGAFGVDDNITLNEQEKQAIKVYKGMKHKHLYFLLDGKTYLLTLAFLKPSTLRYLWENDLLPKYFRESWKCKMVKKAMNGEYWGRRKTTIPLEYNCLDLPTWYTIIFRTLLRVDASFLEQQVFVSELKTKHISKLADHFTPTSIRRAISSEEVAWKGLVQWLANAQKYRMGHTQDSTTAVTVYARNKETLQVNGEFVPLGYELSSSLHHGDIYKLEFDGLAGQNEALDPRFLDNIKDADIRDDFILKRSLVKDFVEKDCDDARKKLLALIPAAVSSDDVLDNIIADLGEIPLGLHVTFDRGGVESLPKMGDNVDEVMSVLKQLFLDVELPSGSKVPFVQSYLMTVYGNFRDLDEDKNRALIEKGLEVQLLKDKLALLVTPATAPSKRNISPPRKPSDAGPSRTPKMQKREVKQQSTTPDIDKNGQVFEVESILGHEGTGRNIKYKIRWAHPYNKPEEDTLEPTRNVPLKLRNEYWATIGKQ